MTRQFYFKQFSLGINTQVQCQKQSFFKQFSLAYLHDLVLFDPEIGRCKVLPFRVRVDLGVNEGVLRIPQSSSITGTSPSNCLVSYPATLVGGVLLLCWEAFDEFYSPTWQGKRGKWGKMNLRRGISIRWRKIIFLVSSSDIYIWSLLQLISEAIFSFERYMHLTILLHFQYVT